MAPLTVGVDNQKESAVKLNPQLEQQDMILMAKETLAIVQESPEQEVAYILGYLCLSDVKP